MLALAPENQRQSHKQSLERTLQLGLYSLLAEGAMPRGYRSDEADAAAGTLLRREVWYNAQTSASTFFLRWRSSQGHRAPRPPRYWTRQGLNA
jgi:hypothetical protein